MVMENGDGDGVVGAQVTSKCASHMDYCHHTYMIFVLY